MWRGDRGVAVGRDSASTLLCIWNTLYYIFSSTPTKGAVTAWLRVAQTTEHRSVLAALNTNTSLVGAVALATAYNHGILCMWKLQLLSRHLWFFLDTHTQFNCFISNVYSFVGVKWFSCVCELLTKDYNTLYNWR